jgi:hypothetical protein
MGMPRVVRLNPQTRGKPCRKLLTINYTVNGMILVVLFDSRGRQPLRLWVKILRRRVFTHSRNGCSGFLISVRTQGQVGDLRISVFSKNVSAKHCLPAVY